MKFLVLPSVLVALLCSCSKPEPLYLGTVALPYATVADAAEDLQTVFPSHGIETLRSHLLQFGLGQAALLHAKYPDLSAQALEEARLRVAELEAGEPYLEVLARWSEANGGSKEIDSLSKPHPSDLGAAVSAAVSRMEPGDWAGPIKTSLGWEVIRLDYREEDALRNRAEVALYRMQFLVGGPEEWAEIDQQWATVSFSGNPELIQALPLSMRKDRVVETPPE